MAKMKASSYIGWGIGLLGTYVLYQKARAGDFCSTGTKGTDQCTLQKLASQIHGALGQGTIGFGGNIIGGTSPNGTTPAPTGSCPFVAGHRYVTPLVNGGFGIVWNDTPLGQSFALQSDAEKAYNNLSATIGCNGVLTQA